MGAPNYPPVVFRAIAAGNVEFGTDIIIALGSLAAATLVYNIIVQSIRYIRTLACLNNEKQRFFKQPHPFIAFVKQHLLYAPLFHRRHSMQLRIGVLDMGILPTRLQSILLAGIIGMNVAFTVVGIEWNGTPASNPMPQQTLLLHLRNRTGTLAIFNMIPLIIMAGRNNPLTAWLGLSFDIFNLLHRWLGRIVVAHAIIHTTVELINISNSAKPLHISGAALFGTQLQQAPFILWGLIAFLAMLIILLTSLSSFRHAFYETFLHIHIGLVGLSLAGLYLHLDGVSTQYIIKILIALWVIERLHRLVWLLYRNLSLSSRANTNATIETLPGDALRVTLHLARPLTFATNQHVYLTIPSIGLWTSHPFSVAWSDAHSPRILSSPDIDTEKALPPPPTASSMSDETSPLTTPQTSISLIMRRRSGFTDAVYRRALANSGHLHNISALIEGPYTSTPNTLHSYGSVVLIAGGVGITHLTPHIRSLVNGYAAGTVAARRVLLVWIIQSPEHLEWIRPWMTSILALDRRREVLRIQLFVTRPRSTREIHSPSATVQMFPGKPNVGAVIEGEVQAQVGKMGVCVCGPGGLGDDVRMAVRRRQDGGNIDFVEQGFGW